MDEKEALVKVGGLTSWSSNLGRGYSLILVSIIDI